MLNPKPNEFLIDPACGSAGFLLHSVMWIAGGTLTGKELPTSAKNFAQNNIYGIDFASDAVKIAKAINLIIGDGKSHIYGGGAGANSLNPLIWNEDIKAGLRPRLLRIPNNSLRDRENQNRFIYLDFHILMTNPPFAGTINERDVLRLYKLSDKNGRWVKKIGRHIPFVERSLQFIRPGGRMAIVLPQGLLNNINTEYIRRYLIDEARILAVIGLHVNTFKPHTGTKTGVLFLQKYSEEEKQKIQEIKAKYEIIYEDFIKSLKEKYQDISWDALIENEQLPDELRSFIESYFESTEELEDEDFEQSEGVEEKGFKSPKKLVEELQEVQNAIDDKQEKLNDASDQTKDDLKKEIKTLKAMFKKIHLEVLERTLSGQIWLILNDKKTGDQFKRFWIENTILREMDYPIFFAVNQKPVKNQSGDYNYNWVQIENCSLIRMVMRS